MVRVPGWTRMEMTRGRSPLNRPDRGHRLVPSQQAAEPPSPSLRHSRSRQAGIRGVRMPWLAPTRADLRNPNWKSSLSPESKPANRLLCLYTPLRPLRTTRPIRLGTSTTTFPLLVFLNPPCLPRLRHARHTLSTTRPGLSGVIKIQTCSSRRPARARMTI